MSSSRSLSARAERTWLFAVVAVAWVSLSKDTRYSPSALLAWVMRILNRIVGRKVARSSPQRSARSTGGELLESSVTGGTTNVRRHSRGSVAVGRRVQDFELWKRIGKGGFGEVWMATKTGDAEVYAMKILEKEHILKLQSASRAIQEKKILQKLDNPFVISLKYAFQDEHKLYLVLDYVGGGDMFRLYKRRAPQTFTEAEVKFYCCEIILALEHLHTKDIIFRDLKLENVLMTLDGHIMLTDFGVAKQSLFRSHTFVGTPHYMAPEIIANKDHGPEVDWWALGVLCYELLVGELPFSYEDDKSFFPNTNQTVRFPRKLRLSRHCKNFVRALLQRDPKQRLGAVEGSVTAHAFFADVNWEDVFSKAVPPPLLPEEEGLITKLDHQPRPEYKDAFRNFTVYDRGVDRFELTGKQKLLATRAVHPFFDTQDDDIAEVIANELIEPNAVCYLQGSVFQGVDGYLAYRRRLHATLRNIIIKITEVKHEGSEGSGDRVTVWWELSGFSRPSTSLRGGGSCAQLKRKHTQPAKNLRLAPDDDDDDDDNDVADNLEPPHTSSHDAKHNDNNDNDNNSSSSNSSAKPTPDALNEGEGGVPLPNTPTVDFASHEDAYNSSNDSEDDVVEEAKRVRAEDVERPSQERGRDSGEHGAIGITHRGMTMFFFHGLKIGRAMNSYDALGVEVRTALTEKAKPKPSRRDKPDRLLLGVKPSTTQDNYAEVAKTLYLGQ